MLQMPLTPLLQTFAEDGFYIWLYERPASPWAWIWTALIPREQAPSCQSNATDGAVLLLTCSSWGQQWLHLVLAARLCNSEP